MNNFQPGGAGALTTPIELTIACKKLRNADRLSKSDPFVVVFAFNASSNNFHEVGRTEVIMDNLNPEFSTKFKVDYRFETQQKYKFEVYDQDSQDRNLKSHDFLGMCFTTLGEIVGASNGTHRRQLRDERGSKREGEIIIRSEEILHCRDFFHFKMRFTGLPKIGMLNPDPKTYLEIRRANESGEYVVVHRTEQIKSRDPEFFVKISGQKLCNSDLDRNLKFQLYRYRTSAMKSDFWGEADLTGNEIKTIGNAESRRIGNKSGAQISANISWKKIDVEYSFLDYLQHGMQINCVVAIDFTGSNGNPNDMQSLHYINPNPNILNQYESSILSVGTIIQDYDSDKLFPVYGFGAKLPTGQVSHMFPCNFDQTNPFVPYVTGIIDVYKRCITQVQLYGPTNFAPTIRETTRMAQQNMDGSNYFILLILTDGVITDMSQTIDAIVSASFSPMSIIIVGVGNSDFSAMDDLDCDDGLLASPVNNRKAQRDIVQFVPMNKFMQRGAGDPMANAYLASEVLAEIPGQVSEWARHNKIIPNPDFAPCTNLDAPPPYMG